MYSKTVMDHFLHPRNVGDIAGADAVGTAKNEADGDQVQLHLKLDKDRIIDARMRVMGCVAAIASTSLLTELIQNKTRAEALAITKQELVESLGGLPEQKIKCSLTCLDALHQALGSPASR